MAWTSSFSKSEQIDLLIGNMGYQAIANIDLENPTKPGTAIVWKKSLPETNICTLVPCRAQVATLGKYKLLNLYAPSGSDKKNQRTVFFGQDVFTMKDHGCLVEILIVF